MKVPKARKLPSGNWFIQLRLDGESVPITARTEKECIRLAELTKAEHRAGKREKPMEKEEKTITQMIDDYISDKSNLLSPSTVRNYRSVQKNRFQDLMEKAPSAISEEEWLTAFNKEAAVCATKTLKNAWYFLATVLEQKAKYRLPDVNFPVGMKKKKKVLFLDNEQITAFIKALTENGNNELTKGALLALSSLRRSEIFALDWKDVDLKKDFIRVEGAVVPDENNKFVHKETNKNETSTRLVPILIPELKAVLEEEKKTSGPVVSMSVNKLWERINRLCEKNGLPKIGVHGLRHSFASLCYHLNVPIKVTMDMGGWKDESTVSKIYTHVAKSDLDRYKNEIGAFFAQKNANENANATDDNPESIGAQSV